VGVEIEVRRTTMTGLIGTVVLMYFVAAGYFSSPRDGTGRPILLLPEVRAVEHYRRLVFAWDTAWQDLDKAISTILRSDKAQLLVTSEQAQAAVDDAASLAKKVDATDAPSALVGLKDLTSQTAGDYAAASTSAARWLSAPSGANQTAATAALNKARTDRQQLEANAWLKLNATH
jgi:hypothetical protein